MSRRYAKKVDDNQKDIVSALRKVGCSVIILNDTIDLLVGRHGKTYLLEVKNREGRNSPTSSQKKLFEEWCGGPLMYVRSAEEAIAAVTR